MLQKIIAKRYDKLWGHELWLYSPLVGYETPLANGVLPHDGPLIKIIVAQAPLSVQVHPDDEMARSVEHQPHGKSESWYVLEAQKDATLVLGLKGYNHTHITKRLANGQFAELLVHVLAHVGDFYNIPAGLVHGIGAGITILEIQQPSNLTYRYYDYERLVNNQPRELHLAKALQAQKSLTYKLPSLRTAPYIYHNIVATQIFATSPLFIATPSIVVDIDNHQAFFVQDELVSFNHYALIPLSND